MPNVNLTYLDGGGGGGSGSGNGGSVGYSGYYSNYSSHNSYKKERIGKTKYRNEDDSSSRWDHVNKRDFFF